MVYGIAQRHARCPQPFRQGGLTPSCLWVRFQGRQHACRQLPAENRSMIEPRVLFHRPGCRANRIIVPPFPRCIQPPLNRQRIALRLGHFSQPLSHPIRIKQHQRSRRRLARSNRPIEMIPARFPLHCREHVPHRRQRFAFLDLPQYRRQPMTTHQLLIPHQPGNRHRQQPR